MPYEFEGAFQSIFRHLAGGDLPLVFNCTAGKDRTGVAAALVLTALGVPREVVFEDYLLTEHVVDRICDMVFGDKGASFFGKLERAVWEPLISVRADYLNAMFSQLQQAHGSVEGYLSERLDIDSKAIERCRLHLLE